MRMEWVIRGGRPIRYDRSPSLLSGAGALIRPAEAADAADDDGPAAAALLRHGRVPVVSIHLSPAPRRHRRRTWKPSSPIRASSLRPSKKAFDAHFLQIRAFLLKLSQLWAVAEADDDTVRSSFNGRKDSHWNSVHDTPVQHYMRSNI